MAFDSKEIFANLAEKEKLKGHHSPEGRAIRVLSRALNGWSAGSLSGRDVAVLCDQAVEDWLNARLNRSPWSIRSTPELVPAAVARRWISEADGARLQSIHNLRARSGAPAAMDSGDVEAALEFCIELIDKHW